MAEPRQFKYREKVTASGFTKALSSRVDDYFHGRRISRHANLEMFSKTALGFSLWIATYAWLMTGRFSAPQVVGVYVVHGFAQLYMAFNIAHDANHGAYSKSKRVNRALSCVFDLVGASSYMWRLLHNDSHHAFVNIREADTTLVSGHVFRFTPQDERRPYHRYQHLYAPFLYCLSTLDWVLTKDFRWLFTELSFGNKKIVRHPRGELVLLVAGKAFYYTYMLVLPLLYLDAPWYSIVAGFIVMHLFLGFSIALIFQPNHFNEEAAYPQADDEGQISNNYIQHIFDTTSDYARGNPFACWILGCLNLHVIHHMFPGICHVHYPALTRIAKATAEEHGLSYRENRTITGAFLAHLRWLKVLGSADEVAGAVPLRPAREESLGGAGEAAGGANAPPAAEDKSLVQPVARLVAADGLHHRQRLEAGAARPAPGLAMEARAPLERLVVGAEIGLAALLAKVAGDQVERRLALQGGEIGMSMGSALHLRVFHGCLLQDGAEASKLALPCTIDARK